MAKILIIEDDEMILEELESRLSAENYTVDSSNCGDDGLYRLEKFDYDVAIIDWNLPDIEGIEICRRIRRVKPQLPLLMLTSRHDLADKVKGLDSGAFDYLAKPCDLSELSARIRSLLRRYGEATPGNFLFADLDLNTDTRESLCRGESMKLTRMEFDILWELLHNTHGTLNFTQLAARVKKEVDGDKDMRDSLKQRIKTLRQKLKQAGSRTCIEFVDDAGYVLRDGA